MLPYMLVSKFCFEVHKMSAKLAYKWTLSTENKWQKEMTYFRTYLRMLRDFQPAMFVHQLNFLEQWIVCFDLNVFKNV